MRYLSKGIYMLIFILMIVSGITGQNYYETLGEYKIELIGEMGKKSDFFKEYECTLNIYDEKHQILKQKYFDSNNKYEMGKYVINKTGEEAIFILTQNFGANTIWGNLLCIKLKTINTIGGILSIPIFVSYDNMSLETISEDATLNDLIKDIDGDGILEIFDKKWILIGPTGKIAGSIVNVYLHLKTDKVLITNELLESYLLENIEESKLLFKLIEYNCEEKDELAIFSYQNHLASIMISYMLINKTDEGMNFFDKNYKCKDSELLKKKILAYYYDNF